MGTGSERTCLRITMQKFSVVDFASSANSLTVPDIRLPRVGKSEEREEGGEHEGTLMHNGGGATRSTYTRSLPRSRIVIVLLQRQSDVNTSIDARRRAR